MFSITNENTTILSLSELANSISIAISGSFPSLFWVKAEIARLNYYPESGHCYPDLVEKDEKSLKAQMKGIIWGSDFQRISARFQQVAKEPLKDGIQILFRAAVRFHPVYGLSLQITDIDPAFTLGQLARDKLLTIQKLKSDGLFDRNRQVPFPLLPKRVAVISVSTSKGYSDFISILVNNPWRYSFKCRLFPAILQGERAVESITEQLQTIRKYKSHYDVVTIIRGGGGDVGLACYDHVELAKAVATFPLPVITGIGHSTNETVVEMVAHLNKITPTDVAYTLIQQFHNFSALVDDLKERMMSLSLEMIKEGKKDLDEEVSSMISAARYLLDRDNQHLQAVIRDFQVETKSYIEEENMIIRGAETSFRFRPGQVIKDHYLAIDQHAQILELMAGSFIDMKKNQLENIENKVRLLDPRTILGRGYSITYQDGKLIREAKSVEQGAEIISELFSGKIKSIVKSTED